MSKIKKIIITEFSLFIIFILLLFVGAFFLFGNWEINNLKKLTIDEEYIYTLDDRNNFFILYKNDLNGNIHYAKYFPKYNMIKKEIYRYPTIIAGDGKVFIHKETYGDDEKIVSESIMEISLTGNISEVIKEDRKEDRENMFFYNSFSYIDGKLYFFRNSERTISLLSIGDDLETEYENIKTKYISYNDITYIKENGIGYVFFADNEGYLYKSTLLNEHKDDNNLYKYENVSVEPFAFSDGLYNNGKSTILFENLANDKIIFVNPTGLIKENISIPSLDKRSPSLINNNVAFICTDKEMKGKTVLVYKDILGGARTTKPIIIDKINFSNHYFLINNLLTLPLIVFIYIIIRVYLFFLLQYNTPLAIKMSLFIMVIIFSCSLLLYNLSLNSSLKIQKENEKEKIKLYNKIVMESISKTKLTEIVSLNTSEDTLKNILNIGFNENDNYTGKKLDAKLVKCELYIENDNNLVIQYSSGLKRGTNILYFFSPEDIESFYEKNLPNGTIDEDIQSVDVAKGPDIVINVAVDLDTEREVYARDGRWLYMLSLVKDKHGSNVAVLETGTNIELIENAIRLSTFELASSTALVFLLIFLSMGIVIGVSLKPLKTLKDGVDGISNGELGLQLHIKANNEIGEIADAFNSMSNYLERYIREATRLSSSYGRFVPKDILTLLDKKSILDVSLGNWSRKNISILYINIQKFYSLVDAMDDSELFRFLNKFFDRLVKSSNEKNGFVSEYHKSGFTCIFSSTEDALESALIMNEHLRSYNLERKSKNRISVEVGMAISSGDVLIGIIGEKNRINLSVLSNHMHVLPHLEKTGNALGSSLILTAGAYANLKEVNKYKNRYLGILIIEELNSKIKMYDFYDCDIQHIKEFKKAAEDNFSTGVTLFYQENFEDARKYFIKTLRIYSNDLASKNYLYLCDSYINNKIPTEKIGITYI